MSTDDRPMQHPKKQWKDYDKVTVDASPTQADSDNEADSFGSSPRHQQQQDNNKASGSRPGFLSSFQLEYPQESLLGMREQREYIRLLDKFRRKSQEEISAMLGGNNQIDIHDYNLFQSYLEVCQDEQADFQNFTKEAYSKTPNPLLEEGKYHSIERDSLSLVKYAPHDANGTNSLFAIKYFRWAPARNPTLYRRILWTAARSNTKAPSPIVRKCYIFTRPIHIRYEWIHVENDPYG